MNNFDYCNPTRIVFGRGSIAELARLVPAGKKVLVTYGGGSIKRNGVYEQVVGALKDKTFTEFGGIEPNPTYETCMKAVEKGRAEGVEFLLAVGGGSVLDGTKFIAAALEYEGEPWDILAKEAEVTSAVPLGTVLTLPATGSEMNSVAVISRASSQEKRVLKSESVQPRFSILDPEATFSLPKTQVRNGIVDAFVHVLEQYLTYPVNAPLQDRQAEAVCLTLIEEGPRTLSNPTDYDARANLMWCATQALNGLIGCGVPGDFATHLIGHELTAYYGVAHAESLAAVLPAVLRHEKARKAGKLLQYARRVWAIDGADEDAAIEEAVRRTEGFFESLGMPTGLSAFDIPADEAAERVRDRFAERGTTLGEHEDITPEQVAEILKMAR